MAIAEGLRLQVDRNESLTMLHNDSKVELQTFLRKDSQDEIAIHGLNKFEVKRGQTSDGRAGKDNVEDQVEFDEDAIKDLLESSVVTEE